MLEKQRESNLKKGNSLVGGRGRVKNDFEREGNLKTRVLLWAHEMKSVFDVP